MYSPNLSCLLDGVEQVIAMCCQFWLHDSSVLLPQRL